MNVPGILAAIVVRVQYKRSLRLRDELRCVGCEHLLAEHHEDGSCRRCYCALPLEYIGFNGYRDQGPPCTCDQCSSRGRP